MPTDLAHLSPALTEVVLRVGLNLQPGQPLLVTDPYDLFGVHPEAMPLAEGIRAATPDSRVTINPADPADLRTLVSRSDVAAYGQRAAAHARQISRHVEAGGACLFLTGGHPTLFTDLPPEVLDECDRLKWSAHGPVIQQLVRGSSQWTLMPAPTSDWAQVAGCSVADLWTTLAAALRLDAADPVADWQRHLGALETKRTELNQHRHRRIRYTGQGTDLALELPRSHVWCSARLLTKRGLPFVANLPTEELFTAPHRASAEGRVQVSRPVAHHGTVMEDIILEFQAGRVVRASARKGEAYLHRLLAADTGAARIGEVALLPGSSTPRTWTSRAWGNALLDENAANHVALGDAYRFCSRAWWPRALNSSRVHLDLPLDAAVELG